MNTLNRSLVIIRPKEPFAKWAWSVNDEEPKYSLEEEREDCTAYLLPVGEQVGDEKKILAKQYRKIFEEELSQWMTDESVWPARRDFKTFKAWFEVEFCSVVLDLSSHQLLSEES